MEPTAQIINACSLIADIPGTLISGVWTGIFYAFSSYWFLVVPALLIWVVAEVLMWNNHDFNSANGLSPTFNSFVGGGVFLLTETLFHWILGWLAGHDVSCDLLWIRTFYLLPFFTTGLLLHAVGFWPYWKIPILRIKIDLFGRSGRF